MGKKNRRGVVYSTNPDYTYEQEQQEEQATLPPAQQKLRISRDRSQRKGKEVTLITGFIGTREDRSELGKWLKQQCGVGGSTKEGDILLQGNHREKVLQLLIKKGYQHTKLSGG